MAQSQSQPVSSYRVVAHQSALRELHDAPSSVRSKLRDKAYQAAKRPQPSTHPSLSIMRGTDGIIRIKHGDYRALCDLSSPEFRVLLVDHREYVYDRLHEAQERRE